MKTFLANVDPFDAGGQFIDRGHSYTLAVYWCTEDERLVSESAVKELEKQTGRKVQISIEPFKAFYMAEEYHQDWYRKHPEAFACEMKASGRVR